MFFTAALKVSARSAVPGRRVLAYAEPEAIRPSNRASHARAGPHREQRIRGAGYRSVRNFGIEIRAITPKELLRSLACRRYVRSPVSRVRVLGACDHVTLRRKLT